MPVAYCRGWLLVVRSLSRETFDVGGFRGYSPQVNGLVSTANHLPGPHSCPDDAVCRRGKSWSQEKVPDQPSFLYAQELPSQEGSQ
jgi:hypothetical protein